MPKTCLFCKDIGPASKEHIIPESLGNNELFLVNEVCQSCNNYFAKVEEIVLQKTSIAFWRAFLGIKTKKGRYPSVDLSQPKQSKGVFPAVHPEHSNGIGFTAHGDGSTSVDISDDSVIRSLLSVEMGNFGLL